MESSHAKPQDQGGLQTRVHQLENECSELKQECENLRRTNSVLVQNQLKGDSKLSELEGEVASLNDRLERAEAEAKYFEVRYKNRKWKYPLAVPTIPELCSLGYDERESERLVNDITDIMDDTLKMRRGKKIVHLSIGRIGVDSPCWEGKIPHYKEYINALAEYRHTIEYHRDDKFHMGIEGDIEFLPKEVLDLLQEALRQTHFDKLGFCGFGVGYVDFISKCVSGDARLKDLRLDRIHFEPGNIDIFCQAVNNHDSLQELRFEFISFESQEENFGGIMSKLKSKSLECIEIYSDIFSDLRPGDMDFLVSCPSLKSLWFYGDQLSDGDIVIMQDALRNNKTLTRLSLNFRDPPNDIDLHCLVPFVFDRTSLNSAYESNHHCLLEVCYWDNDVHYRRQINTGNAMWNRRKKIYIILSTRNINRRNAAHFESDDIGIKHIPQILSILKPFSEHALHNEYSDIGEEHEVVTPFSIAYNEDSDIGDEQEVTPLSIAYEILRDWKMPELYSYLDRVDE
eukprot:scaffold25832_cov60-Cyclotella_meneghiniana.AAC.8